MDDNITGFSCLRRGLALEGVALPLYVAGEWSLRASKHHAFPFAEITLDVLVSNSSGERRVPGFYAGDGLWKFRLSSSEPGLHQFRTECSDASDAGLHGVEGAFTVLVETAESSSPLLRHGPVAVEPGNRYLQHFDGTPFLLLADSWWHGMTSRLRYPGEFAYLVNYRRNQGFNALQFAVDNPCDVGPFDPRGANEAGHGWRRAPGTEPTSEEAFATINPPYWDLADHRIFHLIDAGLLPSILASWGYYLEFMGDAKMRQHWRYVMARYGALPVLWLLCGEVRLPWYPILRAGGNGIRQTERWTEIARYVRSINGYQRPLGLHPGPTIWGDTGFYPPLTDLSLVDIYYGMGGHGGVNECLDAVDSLEHMQKFLSEQGKPAITGECLWEGMGGGGCGAKTQRMLFWGSVLTGAPGHCYGCDSLWQMNRRDEPFGNTATMNRAWGNWPWDESHKWPGAAHVALGKRILERFDWWKLRPRNERLEPHIRREDGSGLHAACAEIPGECLLVYLAKSGIARITFRDLRPLAGYQGYWISPIDGREYPLAEPVQTDETGRAQSPTPPISQDWLLVLKDSASDHR